MDNKQAISELKCLLEDYWYDDGCGHETKEYEDTIVALDKAIASLECIDEIIELIKNSSDKQYRNNGHWIYIGDKKGLADVLDIINKHLGETKINKKEIEECIDIKPLSEEHIMKIIYTGYSQHDAEAHYDCPYCGRDYGGWELFRDGISQGSVFICKECHKKIMY